MAEFVFKKMTAERGLAPKFRITSFGTSDCEADNPIYPPARTTLNNHGIYGEHRARQLTLSDVINNDYVLVMDSQNLIDVLRLTSGAYSDKIFKLCNFTKKPRDVADPWYTRDFEKAYSDILDGCQSFLNYLEEERGNLLK